jgi:hypothetical protein
LVVWDSPKLSHVSACIQRGGLRVSELLVSLGTWEQFLFGRMGERQMTHVVQETSEAHDSPKVVDLLSIAELGDGIANLVGKGPCTRASKT